MSFFASRDKKTICLIVLNSFVHDTRVLRQANALQEAGFQVYVFAVHEQGLPLQEMRKGVVTLRIPLWSRIPLERTNIRFVRNMEFMIKSLYRIWRLCPVACHCNDLNTLPIGYAAKALFGIPFVYDSHELESQKAGLEQDPAWFRRLARSAEHFLIQKADRVITVGDCIADYLAKQDGVVRPLVVRNIPETPSSAGSGIAVPRHFGFPDDWNIAVFQGGLQPLRGLIQTIQALTFLPENTALVFVGDGPFRKELEREVSRLSLGRRVLFQGWVPSEDLLSYTKEAELGIMPSENVCLSYYFGLPSKFFEYIHAGIPVAVSDFPEIAGITREYGIGAMFNPADPKDIARAILEVIQDPAHYSLLKHNTTKAKEAFTWEKEKERFAKLYHHLHLSL